MAQKWEQGSAARMPQHEESPNLFTPVDYGARLNTAVRRPQQPNDPYGQAYGYQPPVYSAPPSAAPVQEIPAYMQPPQPAQPLMPGTSYGMSAYQNGPVPYLQAFAQPPQPFQQEPRQEREEKLNDAFMPAVDPKPLKKIRPEDQLPQRNPIRIDRVVSVIAAILMLVFCTVAIVRIALTVDRDDRSMTAAEDSFREENGVELQYAAARVELLPKGQTFEPTQPPTATPPATVNKAAVAASAGEVVQETAQGEPTALRTRLTSYPKNPMCNVQESLTDLIAINPEVMGRLVIPGVLDEVVVQRNNTYYLTHGYAGNPSDAGAVFIDESCSLRMPPENLLLRGQSAVGGKVFAKLWQFVSGGTSFAASAATAQLTTLYEQESYVLFAVILSDNDPTSPGYFSYAGYPTFATDEAMTAYVANARARSLYPFQVDVNASDRLLTLATLGSGNQSVVLMYRMARDGENY